MMLRKDKLSQFSLSIWLTLGMFLLVAITFSFYTYSEKQVNHANELRLQSFLLADELRQSSDDLTRMVRIYAITGDPIYKRHYQEILDIRDGKKPRPVLYGEIYWDLVLANDQRPRPNGKAVPLLELMRQAHFTKQEFAKLEQAKANSDGLTRIEFAAMAMIESTDRSTEANRFKAILMLNDAAYLQAKYDIMLPINEFYQLMEQRTQKVVRDAENMVVLVRAMFIAFGALLVFTLWNAYRALHATLGCSVNELHKRISRLGSGDFSTSIPVAKGMENSVIGWLSATQTDLARIDAERGQMEEELRRSNAELDQFAYAVSHDMRQPLRMVTSYLSLIEKSLAGQLDENTRQYILFATDGAKRMDKMILAMLDFSRIGRKTDPITPISSREALNDALTFLNPDIIAKGAMIEVRGDWPEVSASRDEMTRLLQNLIGNALKYHEQGQPPRIEIDAAATPAHFRVSIRDHGIGIDPNQAERLFKVFSRLQAHTRFEGTGVGLALCRKIVEHHGGRIGVESAGEGYGSTFWFELPREKGKLLT